MARCRLALIFVALLLIVVSACKRQEPASNPASKENLPEKYVEVPSAVGFDIELVPGEKGGPSEWLATYRAEDKVARFRVEFAPPKTVPAKEMSEDFTLVAGKGRLIAEPDSDASVLLRDLQKALEARALPKNFKRVQSVPFTFVNLGGEMSQAPEGGFSVDPPGHWTAIKLFIGEGKDEGQVFLNINPAIRKGQFSIKDPDCGDIVLGHLAKVL